MQTEETKRRCKRCLLREYDEAAYKEKLERVLLLMKPHEKADETLYEERLKICRDCEKLLEGTCLACGCYVELRAAGKKERCPYRHW